MKSILVDKETKKYEDSKSSDMTFQDVGGVDNLVAILDHMMPEMDGEALGRAIKADPALKATPLVMLTSWGQRGDVPDERNRFQCLSDEAYQAVPALRLSGDSPW